ncbi:hypothetical protein FPQ18DRAFT_305554 [Pyronema domesticum]|nr:hypothetical protein FPQ18DRAFT_305554 [Pyronema domesticum]
MGGYTIKRKSDQLSGNASVGHTLTVEGFKRLIDIDLKSLRQRRNDCHREASDNEASHSGASRSEKLSNIQYHALEKKQRKQLHFDRLEEILGGNPFSSAIISNKGKGDLFEKAVSFVQIPSYMTGITLRFVNGLFVTWTESYILLHTGPSKKITRIYDKCELDIERNKRCRSTRALNALHLIGFKNSASGASTKIISFRFLQDLLDPLLCVNDIFVSVLFVLITGDFRLAFMMGVLYTQTHGMILTPAEKYIWIGSDTATGVFLLLLIILLWTGVLEAINAATWEIRVDNEGQLEKSKNGGVRLMAARFLRARFVDGIKPGSEEMKNVLISQQNRGFYGKLPWLWHMECLDML